MRQCQWALLTAAAAVPAAAYCTRAYSPQAVINCVPDSDCAPGSCNRRVPEVMSITAPALRVCLIVKPPFPKETLSHLTSALIPLKMIFDDEKVARNEKELAEYVGSRCLNCVNRALKFSGP